MSTRCLEFLKWYKFINLFYIILWLRGRGIIYYFYYILYLWWALRLLIWNTLFNYISLFINYFLMLGKFLLVASSVSFVRGFYLLRRERYLNRIFKDVEKMPIYNLDYLKSVQDLPTNQYVLLCARIDKVNEATYIKSHSTPPTDLIYRSFLPTQKEVVESTPEKPRLGRIWKS